MSNPTRGRGYMPDVPGVEDLSPKSARIKSLLSGTAYGKAISGAAGSAALLSSKDLRSEFPPVFDQGQLGSCTANAAAGLIDYFERKANGDYVDPSRLFIYKVTRDLDGSTGDTGAYLRTTMKALKLFGVPPEEVWEYDSAAPGFNKLFDLEPTAFCYAYGRNYAAVEPFRLDPIGSITPTQVLEQIKVALSNGFPSVFGFNVYPEFENHWDHTGDILYPALNSQSSGGHAIVAVGYDDAHAVGGKPGALIVRNSWGADWGLNGYAYMSYDYVTQGLAVDWWTMAKQQWIDTGKFN
jgi:C1A family cysteine protease